ncbi:MAG: long-chain fatty acid--CoA ligase [Desulfobacterales bacterium]|nr:long-chain fatty acid--CoA ligase [Desulfobacterales bacterium]
MTEAKLWHKSYAPGVKTHLTYEKLTVSAALTRSAQNFPDHTALNYMGKRVSFAELDRLVNAFVRALSDFGIQPGDKVAVCLPNIPEAVIANYAIFRLGAVAVQNNPLYTERELAYQLNDSDSRLLVTLSLLLPRIEKIRSQTKIEKIIACNLNASLPFPLKQLFPLAKREMYRKIPKAEDVFEFGGVISRYPDMPLEESSHWEEVGALLYTGGTTGQSKGVMLTHANLSSNVQQFAAWFPELNPGEERLVGNFPFFHSAGFTAIQNCCLWMAWEIILVPRPDAQINIKMIKKYKPTFLPGVPTIFVGLLAEPEFRKMDLSSIKGFFSGAAPLAADTIRDLKDLTGADLCEVYGSTENSPIATVTPWGGKIKPGTVGCPVPDTDIKLMDIETGETEVPAGEPGEIAIKGPQVMKGYYKKPDETQAVLKDGWFYSGDIGSFGEDGYLSIVDRKKDMIIAGGYNIYPIELDNVLFDHPKILEACTIGKPDKYRGETVKAFIVLKKGETLTEAEVIQYCKEQLAPYKVPKQVEFIDELPKSAVGKILRRKLREVEIQKSGEAA